MLSLFFVWDIFNLFTFDFSQQIFVCITMKKFDGLINYSLSQVFVLIIIVYIIYWNPNGIKRCDIQGKPHRFP